MYDWSNRIRDAIQEFNSRLAVTTSPGVAPGYADGGLVFNDTTSEGMVNTDDALTVGIAAPPAPLTSTPAPPAAPVGSTLPASARDGYFRTASFSAGLPANRNNYTGLGNRQDPTWDQFPGYRPATATGFAEGGTAGLPQGAGIIPGPVTPGGGDNVVTPVQTGEYITPVDAIIAKGRELAPESHLADADAHAIGKLWFDGETLRLKTAAGNPTPPRNMAPGGFDQGGIVRTPKADPLPLGQAEGVSLQPAPGMTNSTTALSFNNPVTGKGQVVQRPVVGIPGYADGGAVAGSDYPVAGVGFQQAGAGFPQAGIDPSTGKPWPAPGGDHPVAGAGFPVAGADHPQVGIPQKGYADGGEVDYAGRFDKALLAPPDSVDPLYPGTAPVVPVETPAPVMAPQPAGTFSVPAPAQTPAQAPDVAEIPRSKLGLGTVGIPDTPAGPLTETPGSAMLNQPDVMPGLHQFGAEGLPTVSGQTPQGVATLQKMLKQPLNSMQDNIAHVLTSEAPSGGMVRLDGKDLDIGNIPMRTDIDARRQVLAGIPETGPLNEQQRAALIAEGEDDTRKFVRQPFYGEGGKVVAWRSVEATPENSFMGKHVDELLGANPTSERIKDVTTAMNERGLHESAIKLNEAKIADFNAQAKQRGAAVGQRDRELDIKGQVAEAKKQMGHGGVSGLDPATRRNLAISYATTGKMPPLGMGAAAAADRQAILNEWSSMMQTTGGTVEDQVLRQSALKASQGELSALQSQRGKVMAFAKTAEKSIDAVEQLSDKLDRTGSPLVNKWLLAGKGKVLGDPDVARYNSAILTAVTEYAKVVSSATGGQVTSDSARHEVQEMLNNAHTAEQVKQVSAFLRQEMGFRTAGYEGQIDAIKSSIYGPAGPPAESAPGAKVVVDTSRPVTKGGVTGYRQPDGSVLDASGRRLN